MSATAAIFAIAGFLSNGRKIVGDPENGHGISTEVSKKTDDDLSVHSTVGMMDRLEQVDKHDSKSAFPVARIN